MDDELQEALREELASELYTKLKAGETVYTSDGDDAYMWRAKGKYYNIFEADNLVAAMEADLFKQYNILENVSADESIITEEEFLVYTVK